MLRKRKKVPARGARQLVGDRFLGKNLNFAAAEAYKLLRTNLSFCLRPD